MIGSKTGVDFSGSCSSAKRIKRMCQQRRSAPARSAFSSAGLTAARAATSAISSVSAARRAAQASANGVCCAARDRPRRQPDRGNMDELHQRPSIRARVAMRASRRSCTDSARHRATNVPERACPRGAAQQATNGRIAIARCRAAGAMTPCCGRRPLASGNSTDSALRARVSMQSWRRAAGETEHQHDVRLVRRTASADRDRRPHSWSQRRATLRSSPASAGRRLPRQRLHQRRRARIERRAGERAEAGEEDAHASISARACRRSPRRPRPAPGGRRRPRPRSAASAALSARSDRSGANSRSSSIVHIHFTCCSPRRAASSPDRREPLAVIENIAPQIRRCRRRSSAE